MPGPWEPVELAAQDLARHLARKSLELDSDGRPSGTSVLVNLDGPVQGLDELIPLLHRTTAVVIGIARRECSPVAQRLAHELTCSVVALGTNEAGREFVPVAEPEAEALKLMRAIGQAPCTATALARLLRVASHLSVDDALAAESAVYSMLLAGTEFARWLSAQPPRREPDSEGPPVRVARSDDTLDVVIDRPARRNAYNRFVREGLIDALDMAIADPSIRVMNLRGAGPHFCSGGDIAEFGLSSDVSVAHLIRLDRSVASRIYRSRHRVVVHLHGACIGAGIEIPSFAGWVVAREDMYAQLPELQMGLIPGAGGTVGIPLRIGRWRFAYLALAGARLELPAALTWGLVDAIADG